MRSLQWTLIVAAGLTLAACGETTGSRTLSGGAMGAAGGAAIGGASGLLGGFLFDQQRKGNIDF